MCKASLNLSLLLFRSRVLVWMLLTIFSCSFLPSISLAQQPTATISTLSGMVLVNGQEQGKGTVLNAGDVIETQAGASVVLELSDGSLLEVDENTKVDMAELAQTATGARLSLVKLMWGHIRAKLSSGHQQAGSSFDIETPNALVGVKFSEPDIEVSYNMERIETVGIAHTVELMAKNLLTDEEKLVPIGSTVIIVGMTIKIMAGIAVGTVTAEAAGAGSTEATATGAGTTAGTGTAASGAATGGGMSKGTMVALGVGAAAAVGGVAAVAASSSNGNGSGSGNGGVGSAFIGTYRYEDTSFNATCESIEGVSYSCNITFVREGTITQDETSFTMTFEEYDITECCTAQTTSSIPLTIVDETTATFSFAAGEMTCRGVGCSFRESWDGGSATLSLLNSGELLRLTTSDGGQLDFSRLD